MITYKNVVRVAEGGIADSGSSVDLAKMALIAVSTCAQAWRVGNELQKGGPHHEDTFTATEVYNIIVNLVRPLDAVCASVIDNGDGRTILEAYGPKAEAESGD